MQILTQYFLSYNLPLASITTLASYPLIAQHIDCFSYLTLTSSQCLSQCCPRYRMVLFDQFIYSTHKLRIHLDHLWIALDHLWTTLDRLTSSSPNHHSEIFIPNSASVLMYWQSIARSSANSLCTLLINILIRFVPFNFVCKDTPFLLISYAKNENVISLEIVFYTGVI